MTERTIRLAVRRISVAVAAIAILGVGGLALASTSAPAAPASAATGGNSRVDTLEHAEAALEAELETTPSDDDDGTVASLAGEIEATRAALAASLAPASAVPASPVQSV